MTTELQRRRMFVNWYDQHAEPDEFHAPTEDVDDMMSVLFALTRQTGRGRSLVSPDAETLEALLDLIDDDDDLSPMMAAIVDVLTHYLQFLGETGQWQASEQQYDEAFEVLEEAEAGVPGILELLVGSLADAPTVADAPIDGQLRAIEALVPVAAVDGLLAWIGRSRPITSSGALRLADIEPVAALIGIEARGKRNAKRAYGDAEAQDAGAQDAGAQDAESSRAPARLEVSTMWDIPELAAWWTRLLQVGVIETTSTTVRPGATVAAWNSQDQADRFGPRREFVRSYVTGWFVRELMEMGTLAPLVVTHLLAQLASAVSLDALPQLGNDAISHVLTESTEHAGLDFGDFGALRAGRVLNVLQSAGVLMDGQATDGTSRLRVPDGLRPIVAESLSEVIANTIDADRDAAADDLDLPDFAHPLDTELQLKITLADTYPAIWRRVVVDADATLGHLHSVIQSAFRWEYAHPHRFNLDGWYGGGLAFGPPAPNDAFGSASALIDENAVVVGAVLEKVGDELFYLYDFGDDWRHLIKLERAEVAETTERPRLVDGEGHAPTEDSGGPWTWSELAQIAADPKHPDRADARERLDLGEDERFDPSVFDRDEVNLRLRSLRR